MPGKHCCTTYPQHTQAGTLELTLDMHSAGRYTLKSVCAVKAVVTVSQTVSVNFAVKLSQEFILMIR
jgi:hypothetical protein